MNLLNLFVIAIEDFFKDSVEAKEVKDCLKACNQIRKI